MSDVKQTQEKWRAEELRAQRKARLAKMKAKSGGKKPIQTTNPNTWKITAVILALALVITGVWAAASIGLPQRLLTAVTVGGERIKAVEVNYYYYNLLSNYGIDPNTEEGQATLDSPSGIEGFPTADDFIKDAATQQVQQYVLLANAAADGGVALDETDFATIENYFASLTSSASEAGSTLDNFLITTFGVGMTRDHLDKILQRYLLANKYAAEKQESFTFTDEEMEQFYTEHTKDYDLASYRYFYLKAVIPDGATDEQKTAAMTEAEELANEMMEQVKNEATFKALCIEYAADADKEKYQTTDASLYEDQYYSNLSSLYADWVFGDDRVEGDTSVVKASSGYYVLYFIERARADFQHVNVRHILIKADKEKATEEELAKAEEKAESILAEYQAGDKTEEAFGKLAQTYSEDNAEAGGLYENIYPGVMVEEFEDWCLDKSRKPGDTGIVQTDYGFHVMYLAGYYGADWKLNADTDMRSESYSAYLEDLMEKNPVKSNSIGMKFVG